MKKAAIFYLGVVVVLMLAIGIKTGVLNRIYNSGSAQIIASLSDAQVVIDQMKADMTSLLSLVKTGIVVDNSDTISTTRVGTWEKATAVSQFYGSNYEIIKSQTGSFTFSPNITRAGTYEVSLRWTEGSNRTPTLPISIIPEGQTEKTTIINQRLNGGRWVSIGTYDFPIGKNSKVVLNLKGTSGYTVADAVRFDFRAPSTVIAPSPTPTPTPTPTPVSVDIIMDNASSSVTKSGPWINSSYIKGYYGNDYLIGAATDGTVSATFVPNIPTSGKYNVYTRWTSAWAERSSNVPVEIIHKLGKTTAHINQTQDGTTWKLLGTFSFDAGTAGKVNFLTSGTTGDVVADAVRFTQTSNTATLTDVDPAVTNPVVTIPSPTPEPTPEPAPAPTPAPTPTNIGIYTDNTAVPAGAIIVTAGQSVQNAINNAPAGSTIVLRAGTYNENIIIQKTITLRNYPGERPIINAPDSAHAAIWFLEDDNVTARNSRIAGLEIIGGYYAVKIDGGEYHPGLNNGIVIENIKAHDMGFDGIKVTFNGDNIVIRNNEVYRTGRNGTNAQGIDSVGNDYILIQNNFVHDTVSDGIFTKGGSKNAIIENNRVVNTGLGIEGGNGIMTGNSQTNADVFNLSENPGMKECLNCIVRNNIIDTVANYGIGINGADGTRLENNTITNARGAGVIIQAVENWPVTGGYLQISSSNVTMTGNRIKGSSYGVFIKNNGMGEGISGSFNGSNNTYYNPSGTVSFRDDTRSFNGGFTQWQQIRTDIGSKEAAW